MQSVLKKKGRLRWEEFAEKEPAEPGNAPPAIFQHWEAINQSISKFFKVA